MKYKKPESDEDKESYEHLTGQIEELLDSKIEITNISFLGYNEAAFFIRFKLKEKHLDKEFELTVPDTEQLNSNNLNELHGGKLSLSFSTNTSCWDLICDSYDEKELKNKFNKWLMHAKTS